MRSHGQQAGLRPGVVNSSAGNSLLQGELGAVQLLLSLCQVGDIECAHNNGWAQAVHRILHAPMPTLNQSPLKCIQCEQMPVLQARAASGGLCNVI